MIRWTRFERRWRDALVAAALPPDRAGRLPGLGAVALEPFWAELAAVAPPLLRFGLRAATWGLTWTPAWTIGRWRRFTALSAAERDAHLVAAASHPFYPLRQLATTIKVVACLAYFRDPAVRGAFATEPAP